MGSQSRTKAVEGNYKRFEKLKFQRHQKTDKLQMHVLYVGMGMGDMGGAAFDLGKEIAGTSMPYICT